MFLHVHADGLRLEGHTAAVEDGDAWAVRYSIDVDEDWSTRSAQVFGWSADGHREVALSSDGAGAWLVDGAPAGQLEGCLDVDLESSSLTNALPVHRLDLEVGAAANAPAAYLRASNLAVERLEQRYVLLADEDERQRYDYSAPRFDFRCELVYDEHGLVLDYPGIAARVA